MNDLEIMKSYCNKCKHKGTCHTICPTVWFAVLQKEQHRHCPLIEVDYEGDDQEKDNS